MLLKAVWKREISILIPNSGRKMRSRKTWIIFVFWFVAQACLGANGPGPIQWVDPFIGTGGGGNTFPGALVPWGMVSVSPHNDLHAPSGYVFGKPAIYGFGHVHLSGTGCPDLGSVLVMPTAGEIRTDVEKAKSNYDSETASPGYYRVHLKTYDIQAEMTASTRAGMTQFLFPARKGDANILINVSHRLTNDPVTVKNQFESKVKIISNTELEGFAQSGDFCSVYAGNKQTVFFVAQFSKPAVQAGTWKVPKERIIRNNPARISGPFFVFPPRGGNPS